MDNDDLIAAKKATDEYCEQDETVWTKAKLMACLKRIVHKDTFSKISNVDVLQFATSEKFGNDVVERYLQHLIKKPEIRLQMYSEPFGTVQGLLLDLINTQDVPLFYKYVNLPRSTYYDSRFLQFSSETPDHRDELLLSKSDAVLFLFGILSHMDGEKEAEEFCQSLFEKFENRYEIISFAYFGIITRNLGNGTTANDFKTMMEKCNNQYEPYYWEADKAFFLTRMATIRVFHDRYNTYCFAREVEIATRVAFEKKYQDDDFPENWNRKKNGPPNSVFVRLDNDEDKALGILHIVEIDTLKDLLKSLKLTMDDIRIIEITNNVLDREFISLPMISPYGSHCKTAMDTYNEFQDCLVMEMRLFQRVKRSNLPKITKWYKNIEHIFDGSRNYRYLIETWKLDEIKEKAHSELKRFITEPIYNAPLKPLFTKREILDEIEKFLPVSNVKESVLALLDTRYPSESEYQYIELCRIFVHANDGQITPALTQFYLHQFMTDSYISTGAAASLQNSMLKAKMERRLPPSVKIGKNNLGKVQTPKIKKNTKPDFSLKKFDKEAVMMKALKCFNENFGELEKFEIGMLKEYLNEEELEFLQETLNSKEKRKEIEYVFDVEVNNEIFSLIRKSVEYLTGKIIEKIEDEKVSNRKTVKMEEDLKLKEEEIEKLNKKIADTVQKSVERARRLKEEAGKQNEEHQKEVEALRETIQEVEKNSTTQISINKQKYRDGFNKLNKICEDKEAKNQQLQEELKERCEKLRNEREKKYTQADEDLKIAKQSMEKMKVELENLKLWKTAKSREMAVLEKENNSLKIQLEISEEQKPGTSSEEHVEEHEEDEQKEDIVEELLARNEQLNSELGKMTEKCAELENMIKR